MVNDSALPSTRASALALTARGLAASARSKSAACAVVARSAGISRSKVPDCGMHSILQTSQSASRRTCIAEGGDELMVTGTGSTVTSS